jgi:L-histidine N-alpha-methyltransferase
MKKIHVLIAPMLIAYAWGAVAATNLCANVMPEDFHKLLNRQQEGHLASYMYNGNDNYTQLLADNPNYYFNKNESAVIKRYAQDIAAYMGGDPAQVVEFGPGDAVSVKAKTVPFLQALSSKATGYHAIDIEQKYINASLGVVGAAFPKLGLSGNAANFLAKNYFPQVDNQGRKMYAMFGGTLGNFMPEDQVSLLSKISGAMQGGDYMVISFDMNNDQLSLEKAYKNSYNDKLALNVIKVFKDCLKPTNFDDKAFVPLFNWDQKEHRVKYGVLAKEEQSFNWQGNAYKLRPNEKFFLVQSQKFTYSYVKDLVSSVGMEIVKSFALPGKFIRLFLLKKGS